MAGWLLEIVSGFKRYQQQSARANEACSSPVTVTAVRRKWPGYDNMKCEESYHLAQPSTTARDGQMTVFKPGPSPAAGCLLAAHDAT